MQDVVTSPLLYFPSSGGGRDLSSLQPGVLSFDYSRYYAACRPKLCQYTVTANPQFINAATTALGVISGAAMLIQLAVGVVIERLPVLLRRCRHQPSATQPELETELTSVTDSEQGGPKVIPNPLAGQAQPRT